jgi:hypothetical protein
MRSVLLFFKHRCVTVVLVESSALSLTRKDMSCRGLSPDSDEDHFRAAAPSIPVFALAADA